MSDKKETVYLIGKRDCCIEGFTTDKIIAKQMIAERGNEYSFIKFKKKNAIKIVESMYLEEPIIVCGILLFPDEEGYFLSSFEQYKSDIVRDIEHALELLKYIKFNKKELEVVKELIIELVSFIKAMEHGTLCDDETGGDYNYWSYFNALKYFTKHVLELKIDFGKVDERVNEYIW